jgi:pimeloyl-ACP methyl ester carboxylesterase
MRAATPPRCRSWASPQRITCAIFIMNGRLDRIVPCRDAEGLREVRGPLEFVIIKDSSHVANNAPTPGARSAPTG